MKTSKKSKKESIEPAAPSQAIPPGLEVFAELKNKSHSEQIAAVVPEFKKALNAGNDEIIGRFAGMISGLGAEIDIGIAVPEWAKAASRKFWETVGMDFLGRLQNCEPEDMGKILEFIQLTPVTDSPTKVQKGIDNLAKFIKDEAKDLPAEKNLEFAKGRVRAKKMLNSVTAMSQRTQCYLMISLMWEKFQNFESAGKLHIWFLENKILPQITDPAETRYICRSIGLRLREKAGRPNKNK